MSWLGEQIGRIGNWLINGKRMEDLGNIVGSLALEPVVVPPLPASLPTLTVTLDKFVPLTVIVIDNFEGGYYHPSMLSHFKPSDQKILAASGETMFGLDRKAGAELAKYSEWNQFWSLVDDSKSKKPERWKYNAKEVPPAPTLKRLASEIMYKWFSYLAGRHILISSMDEIANDDRLIIHFSYAAWNGESWFERYAEALNAAIKQFPGNKEAIFAQAIKARTEAKNEAIRRQGANMIALFKRMNLV